MQQIPRDKRLDGALEKIMTAEKYSVSKHRIPYLFELKAGENELFYFGVRHSRDPKDPMFSEIEEKINEKSPNLIMIEGVSDVPKRRGTVEAGLRSGELDRDKIIDLSGESGFSLMIATQKGINCESPEPKDEDMFNDLLEKGFSKDEIFAQQILLVLPQYHRQVNRNGFKEYIEVFIRSFKQNTNWENFDYSYKHALKTAEGLVGRTIDVENDPQPIDYVDPIPWESKKDAQTTLNTISRATGEYRDRFIVKEIATALQRYKKVFVVFGASHAYMQEPALRELVQ